MGMRISHRLRITGPGPELKRFTACFVEAKRGDFFPNYLSDDGRPIARPLGELYFCFDKLVPPPTDTEHSVLAEWGIECVASSAKIEVSPNEIELTWWSGYEPALHVYRELTKVFPRLQMSGDYYQLFQGFGGHVFCYAGKLTHVDTSKLIEAEMEAFYAESEKVHSQGPAPTSPKFDNISWVDEIPF